MGRCGASPFIQNKNKKSDGFGPIGDKNVMSLDGIHLGIQKFSRCHESNPMKTSSAHILLLTYPIKVELRRADTMP
ncbi:hypothetical protein H5410_026392 [Solanum commersonii]|uniref:Uncharacterized protein n=1 Tax=Solanum commersonii TaxID=4109 RepID=A0A9J5Z0K9_SOLCO|nr:hypothetical protein H5410_026392 [Solanum commersonii]